MHCSLLLRATVSAISSFSRRVASSDRSASVISRSAESRLLKSLGCPSCDKPQWLHSAAKFVFSATARWHIHFSLIPFSFRLCCEQFTNSRHHKSCSCERAALLFVIF